MKVLDYLINRYQLDLSISSPFKLEDLDREGFAKMLRDVGAKIGVEIGVCGGHFSRALCRSNPDLHLVGVDPYSMSENNNNFYTQGEADRQYGRALRRLASHKYELIRKTSVEAIKDFEDESLDFVYIDGNHLRKYILEDLHNWPAKVRIGGIISGHDYSLFNQHSQVHEVIHVFTKQNAIHPWFVFGTQAEVESWFWIKT